MKPRYQVSKAAIELIKSFEGFREKAVRLDDGRWAIGYGHTLSTREDSEVSQPDAEALLIYDLIDVADAVNTLTFTPLTQNQFDALCAFVYNIGVEAFRGSEVLRQINEGRLLQAACAMELWRRAEFQGNSLIIDAIVRRRAAEKTLFLTPTKGWVPAPSAILRPTLDVDTLGQVPREVPADLTEDGAALNPPPVQLPPVQPPTEPHQDPEPVRSEPVPEAQGAEDRPLSLAPPEAPAAAQALNSAWPLKFETGDTGLRADPSPQPPVQPEPIVTPRETFGLRQDPLPEPPSASTWRIIDQPRVRLEPILMIAAPALLLAVGGIYWSGHGTLGSGLFHPLVIGWLVCLIGLAGLSYAAYLLLVDLGYIEPLNDLDD